MKHCRLQPEPPVLLFAGSYSSDGSHFPITLHLHAVVLMAVHHLAVNPTAQKVEGI
jgi:hypothetical protein